jgi:hypothetical protein
LEIPEPGSGTTIQQLFYPAPHPIRPRRWIVRQRHTAYYFEEWPSADHAQNFADRLNRRVRNGKEGV